MIIVSSVLTTPFLFDSVFAHIVFSSDTVRHSVYKTTETKWLTDYFAFTCVAQMQNHPDRQDLSFEQGQWLVKLARQTLAEQFAKTIPQKDVDALATALADSCYQVKCGTFVTLTLNKQLRGCIGSLTSDEPIRTGVGRNAINAAFHDPRFKPLNAADFEKVNIEVSILSEPQRLNYRDSDDLVAKLRPGVDGVIVRKEHASATFLPQVWEQLPETHDFLSHLCAKAGLAADAWRQTHLEISTYQVQHFAEPT